MSVIPDIIPHKVYQYTVLYHLSFFLAYKKALKKSCAETFYLPSGYVPKGTPMDIVWAFLIKQLFHSSCSVQSRLWDMR